VCGPRVEQRDEEGAGYVHVDVHSPPSTRLDPGEGVDGDGWLAANQWIADTLLIEHRFDAEEAFAVFFVSRTRYNGSTCRPCGAGRSP
jgi:hypothetical protein